MTEKQLDEAEARRILENLARNGPPTAQVASIKVLREMDKDAAEAEREADLIPPASVPSPSPAPIPTRTEGAKRAARRYA